MRRIECGMRTGCTEQVPYAYWSLGEWTECDNAGLLNAVML
nr:hypothetical protein Q903MT_gene354 [Picea sitchensis]